MMSEYEIGLRALANREKQLAQKLTTLEADAVSLRESGSSLSLLHSAELQQTRDEHRLACRARKLVEEIDRNRRTG
jgi:hypothetical protein